MSRDNNSGRPKKPRSSTRNNSDDSRASKSGNSSGSKPFKKPFPKAGERNSDSKRSGTSYQDRMDKKFGKTEQDSFITSPGEEKSHSENLPLKEEVADQIVLTQGINMKEVA